MIILTNLIIPSSSHPVYPSQSLWPFLSSIEVSPIVLKALELGGWARFFGVIPFLFVIFYYEKYQRWAGRDRWNYSENSTFLGKRPTLVSTRTLWHLTDWLCLPVTGLLFLTLPQLHVHFTQLFTDKIDYKVAAKPSLDVRTRPVSELMDMEPLTSISIEGSPTAGNSGLHTPLEESLSVVTALHEDTKSNISIASRGDSGFFEFDENTKIPPSRSRTNSPLSNTIWRSGMKEEEEEGNVPSSHWTAVV
jgi:hypothetical protein